MPVCGTCVSSCVLSISITLIVLVSTVRIPLSMAANISGENFHPSQVLSSSYRLLSLSSTIEDTTQGEEIEEKEVLYHFFRNGRSRNDFRKPSTAFMVSLFNELQRGGSIVANDSSGTTTDTIRSFSGQKLKNRKQNRPVVDFFIPQLPQHEKLRHAEIRFLRNASNKSIPRKYKFRIDVKKGGKTVRRIVLRGTPDSQSQHDVFEVTKILRPWINGFHGNIIFHVRVSKKFQSQSIAGLKEVTLQSTSLIVLYLEDSNFLTNMYASFTSDDNTNAPQSNSKTASKKKRTLLESYAPFVTLSPQVSENTETNSTNRERRNIQNRKRRNRNNRKWSSKSNQKENCQMYDFEVDFNAIGWGQWIIHPKKFNARFCYGVCPSPMDVQYKPTNHAMLQTLMRLKRPLVAPPPCCVPTKLNPISMLYFEYDEIVVRHHEDMVASECGCR